MAEPSSPESKFFGVTRTANCNQKRKHERHINGLVSNVSEHTIDDVSSRIGDTSEIKRTSKTKISRKKIRLRIKKS